MCLAMALYGVENVSSELALRLGMSFFSLMNVSITSAGYYEYLMDGDHVGDHDLIEVTLSELARKIEERSVSSFRLYNESEGLAPWFASYGYSTNDFGSFFHIDAQSSGEQTTLENYTQFFREIAGKASISYGIAYRCESISKGYSYAAGENFVSIFPFESSGVFKKEVPGRYSGKERYKGALLRMVYEVNLLNSEHLMIDVAGVPLRQWILEDGDNGVLEVLSESIAIWLVEEKKLSYVNERLGKLGLLVSWRTPEAKVSSRKLP